MLNKLAATGVATFAVAGVMLSASPAFAHGGGGGPRNSSEGGVLSGIQANAPITAQIGICGVAIPILSYSYAAAGCQGKASINGGGGHHHHW